MSSPFLPLRYPFNLRSADAHALMREPQGRRGWPAHESNGWSLDPCGGTGDAPNWLRAMLDPSAHHEPGWDVVDEVQGFARWLGESGFALERASMIGHVYRLIPAPVVAQEKPEKGSALKLRAEPSRRVADCACGHPEHDASGCRVGWGTDARGCRCTKAPVEHAAVTAPGPLHGTIVDILIARLNAIVSDPEIAADVWRLIGSRVECSEATANHPTIQATEGPSFGFLGMLNGIVGVREDGHGLIAAEVDDAGRLIGFRRNLTAAEVDSDPVVSAMVGNVVADIAREDYEAIDRRQAEWSHPVPWSLVLQLAGLPPRHPDAG